MTATYAARKFFSLTMYTPPGLPLEEGESFKRKRGEKCLGNRPVSRRIKMQKNTRVNKNARVWLMPALSEPTIARWFGPVANITFHREEKRN